MRSDIRQYIPVSASKEEGISFRSREVVKESGPVAKELEVESGEIIERANETATPAVLGIVHNVTGIIDTFHPTADDIEYMKTFIIEEGLKIDK